MVYTYNDWKLYYMDVNFRVIGKRRSYFFSKRIPKSGTPCDMPVGYEVGVNKRTSMPYLKFAGKKESVWKKRKCGLI